MAFPMSGILCFAFVWEPKIRHLCQIYSDDATSLNSCQATLEKPWMSTVSILPCKIGHHFLLE